MRTSACASGSGRWRRARRAVTEPRGLWIYAVAGQPVDESSLGRLTGVAGAPARTVTEAGLTAVVGDVPLEEFGEQALRRNLEDLAWLGETARAHHRVIEAVAQQVPVVPARLATVYSGDAGVASMLADRGRDLRLALGRSDARKEWGV